jgi:hypothetical protein
LQKPEKLAITGFQEFSAPLWGSGGLGFKSQHYSDLVIKEIDRLFCNLSISKQIVI